MANDNAVATQKLIVRTRQVQICNCKFQVMPFFCKPFFFQTPENSSIAAIANHSFADYSRQVRRYPIMLRLSR